MEIRRGHVYIVDFNPRVRTKPGKLRPAVALQSDLINHAGYPSTIAIPATTRLVDTPGFLRLRVRKGIAVVEGRAEAGNVRRDDVQPPGSVQQRELCAVSPSISGR